MPKEVTTTLANRIAHLLQEIIRDAREIHELFKNYEKLKNQPLTVPRKYHRGYAPSEMNVDE